MSGASIGLYHAAFEFAFVRDCHEPSVARVLHRLGLTVRRRLPIGAEVVPGGVHLRVWAPAWHRVTLVLDDREVALGRDDAGYFSRFVEGLAAGARYHFRLGDGAELFADPASRFQPEGPFGPSEVIDPDATGWTDREWPGITAPQRQVIYELHVGTFTRAGTWAAAAHHLPFLVDLGITTIEIMPIAEFAGGHNWGYDGVDLFAPTHNYGRPEDLRAFVDRAHALGLAVILDVVYNHLGPSGNSLFVLAPPFISTRGANSWGETIDFAVPQVREFVIANAGYWIDEFHLDGLRLDATQAIHDDSDVHIVAELVQRARAAAGSRQIFMIGENESQDVTMFDRGVDAIANDDFHHAARVAELGVTDGYLHDYAGTPQELISATEQGFLYQGQVYAWQRNVRGTPTRGLAPSRFVHYLENHDQIANAGFGERLAVLADRALHRAMTALLLLGPSIPMLFQGQETGSTKPWLFFVDHDPELAMAVRHGRARFVSQSARLATPEAQAALPDPNAPETFAACILDESERRRGAPITELHRDLIALRRDDPTFTTERPDGAVLSPHALCLRWAERLLLVNLGPTFRSAILPEPRLAPLRESGWRVAWSSEHPRYGGHGTPRPFTVARLAIPAHAAVLCVPDPSAWLRVDPKPDTGEEVLVDP